VQLYRFFLSFACSQHSFPCSQQSPHIKRLSWQNCETFAKSRMRDDYYSNSIRTPNTMYVYVKFILNIIIYKFSFYLQ
jgi:hypothetical protein